MLAPRERRYATGAIESCCNKGVAAAHDGKTLLKVASSWNFLRIPIARRVQVANQRKSPLLTTAEAAEFLRLKKHTLENMRWQGTGPPFRKHGGRVFYHRAEIREWSEQARRRSSSGRKA